MGWGRSSRAGCGGRRKNGGPLPLGQEVAGIVSAAELLADLAQVGNGLETEGLVQEDAGLLVCGDVRGNGVAAGLACPSLPTGSIYNIGMQTLTAHFDGKALVPDGPLDLAVGETVEVSIRRRQEAGGVALELLKRLPLIHIAPEDAEAINRDPSFDVEES